MNTTLTGLGIALVLALAAALVGPWFVDWNAYRPMFEARIAAALGVPVRIAGPVSVTLLPTPHLWLTDLRAGRSGDERLAVKALSFDLAITPLLSGRFEVTDLKVEAPTLVATVDGNGRLRLPLDATALGSTRLGAISLGDVTVTGGTVEVVDALTGERRQIDHLDAKGSATSLAGPMKLAGSAVAGGVRYRFRLSTGTFQGGRGNLQFAMTPPGQAPTLDLDGTLAGGAGAPLFTGRATLKPPAEADAKPGEGPPWQFTGRVTASPRKIVADQLDLQFGTAARALHLGGSAEIDLGPEHGVDLVLNARQLDFDRARGLSANKPAEPPLEALRDFARALPALPPPGWPVTASVSVGSTVLGGDLLQDAALSLSGDTNGWTIDHFTVGLPGHARLGVSGRIAQAAGGSRFAGDVSLDARDLPELLRWLGVQGAKRGVVPVRQLSLAGHLTADGASAAIDKLRVTAEGATLAGRAAWRGGDHPGLRLALSADRLDVDRLGLPQLARALGGTVQDPLAGTDLDLALKAGQLDWAGVVAKGVDIDLGRRGSRVDIRRLAVADLGGAVVDAQGQVGLANGRPVGALTAKLEAKSLDGIVGVLRASPAPPALADAIAARAGALAPADLTLALAGTESAEALAIKLDGTLAGTRVAARGRLRRLALDAPLDAKLTATNADSRALLAQIGLPASPVGGDGPADLAVQLSGTPSRGAALDGSATVAGIAFAFDGRLKALRAAAATASGRLTAAGDDLGPLLVLLGRAPPASLPALPVRLQADARFDAQGLALDGLSGAIAGDGIGGDLAWHAGKVTGALKLPRLSLDGLLALAAGPIAAGRGDAWPDGPFAPGILAGLGGTVAVTCGRLELVPGAVLDKAAFTLALGANETALTGLTGTLAGGAFTGEIRLRRAGEQGALALRAKLVGADVARLAWRQAGQPVARGALSFGVDAQGTGTSVAAIVASLAGSGSATVTGARIAGLDPGAFARVAAAAHAMDPIEPARIGPLTATELAKGTLEAGTLSSAFTIAAGKLRADIAADKAAATASGHATVDLAHLSLTADLRLAPAVAPDGGDAPPEIALHFAGPVAAPGHTLDVKPLTGYLTMRSVEREVKQVEALEAERRRQEAARAAAAKAEADRQAALAAERKAEEEKAAAAKAAAEREAAAKRVADPVPADTPPLPPLAPPREVAPPPGARAPSSRVTVGAPLDTRPRVIAPQPGSGPRIIVLPPPPAATDDPIGALLGRP